MRRLNEPSHLDLRCLTFSLSTSHINVFQNVYVYVNLQLKVCFDVFDVSMNIFWHSFEYKYHINVNNRPRVYKTFFMLNSAEHEIFSANKYENANNNQLCLAIKNLQLLVI